MIEYIHPNKVVCPVCNEETEIKVVSQTRSQWENDYLVCQNCKHVFESGAGWTEDVELFDKLFFDLFGYNLLGGREIPLLKSFNE